MMGRQTRGKNELIRVCKLCSESTPCLRLHVAQALSLTKALLFSQICPVFLALGELPLLPSWRPFLEDLAFLGTSVLGEW